jgi:hexokinase
MSAGHYLGKIVTLAAADKLDCLRAGTELTGEDLGLILNDGGQSLRTADLIERRTGTRISQSDCAFLRRLTRAVVARSAQMVACTYLGILDVIDPSHTEHHTIAVDGSLFGKMPMYAKEVERVLAEGLADVEATADLVWAGDGSGIGGAVAAALAETHRGERREYRTFAESMVALYGSKGEA